MNTTTACAEGSGSAPSHFPPGARQLLDLASSACRWPLGDPGGSGFSFCARPRTGRASYCAQHRRLACEAAR